MNGNSSSNAQVFLYLIGIRLCSNLRERFEEVMEIGLKERKPKEKVTGFENNYFI